MTPDRRPLAASPEPVSPVASILFDGLGAPGVEPAEPEIFRDLNLDQVVASILGNDPYGLRDLFWTPLSDVHAVQYRQEVFRDLEREGVATVVRQFADACQAACDRLAAALKLNFPTLRDCRVADAAQDYYEAVSAFGEGLSRGEVRSSALLAFRDYVSTYAGSPAFRRLREETIEVQRALSQVRFSLHLRGLRVTVKKPDPGADYGTEVTGTFARFQEGAGEDHRVTFRGDLWMGHVQEFILERVARLYPEVFASAAEFRATHARFPDPVLVAFAHDVRFYLAVREHIRRLRDAGLPFCYPKLCEHPAKTYVAGAFDLALAGKLVNEGRPVILNDFCLEGAERVIVVTGPNQGGKTTFSRMFGQLHYLASLGLPVPGREAALRLPDRVFTHFDREERVATLRSGLEDELMRVRAILDQATNRSVIVMNESFSSTTLDDARRLGSRVLHEILERGALCTYVTFIDELASLGEATVSMVATVDPQDPAMRTLHVVRAPADGRAYADAIARKYGLSPAQLKGRIKP